MSEHLHILSDDNFETSISNGVTLVDFYADWCGPCKMIAPVVSELASELAGKAKIAKVNVDNAQETSAKYHVTSIPTLILFKNGKEVTRVVGVKDLDTLRTLVVNSI